MFRHRSFILCACLTVSLAACGGDETSGANNGGTDGGTITDPDTSPDSGPDTGRDSGPDVGPDAGPDGGPDSGPDGGPDGGDTDPSFSAPEFYQSSSGGGSVEGGSYRAVIGIGAPVPRGQAEGGGFRVRLGPVSP